ncbi:MAG: glycerol-3-phosphate 1-O-acyltransferase PlsY [Clostridiaceae bacterium]|nr:glycerol-3-phosphate 1-O-acyltransferase PlsY [Clostridiaceae bacterium]
MNIALSVLIAYLLGSVNSSIIISKLWANTDIRKHGSGNAGATNTLRTLGKTAAAVVVIGDVLKGVVSVIIGWYLAGEIGGLAAGIASVLGHNYPLYFGFKGGKGILTSAGVVMMIHWKIGVLLVVIVLLIIAITRYVSLGSVIGAFLYPLFVYFMYNNKIEYMIFSLCLAALAVYRHKGNIKRLLNGTELKLGTKVKG